MNNCEQKISIIKNIRNEQGMLLKKVAADLNLNKSVLQAIESGRKSTIAERAHSIAAFIIDQLKNCLYLLIIERELYKSKP
jgi:transcriptional regulator with XRE-family HTH domain